MSFGVSRTDRVISRLRMPLVAAGVLLLAGVMIADVAGDPPGWLPGAATIALLTGLAFYLRLGTPHADTADVAAPVRGRWRVLNSPRSRVPSHHLHGWSQTYAVDLVPDPEDSGRPAFGWWPVARRPQAFPGFGTPVLAPVEGTVVRAFGGARDHWSRTSPPALLYLVVESVRELLGPVGILGNHVVVRREDGLCVLLAHLRRGSLKVRVGDRVRCGEVVAQCGNSGNSTEPHLHCQVMDRPSVWIATGMPFHIDGKPLPRDGETLTVA